MQIKVSGKQIDVGEALSTHVEDRLLEAVGKYFDRPVDSGVVFSRDGHSYRCDASVHLTTGLTAKAQGMNAEIYSAFDQAAERIEKQIRRHHRRLKAHHNDKAERIEAFSAPSYVIAANEDDDDGVAVSNGEPVIIAEMQTSIQTFSVSDAVMQMELAHVPFLMFKNSASGRLNIVFQRDDGNIGWVDPANLTQS
ncbi:ribosome-associated translation inhibitor RaiA [Rhodobacteraceae bacterium NNCM2]|nr:ribosome-associated translation inhibitor RaiA [Coraliihabitans acroporae]